MAERLDIVVTKSGDKEAAQGIAAIGDAADKTGEHLGTLITTVDFLKGVLEGLAGAFTVGELIKTAQVYEEITNKLKLTATSAKDLAATEDALFQASQRSFSSFESNVDVYNKLALQAHQLGIDTKEIVPTIELLNKAMIGSGASGEQAKQGLEELTRGLELGSFQGRNFLTIIRQVPFVAEEIAKGMGITVDQLRKLASTGELTTRQVIDALNKQAPEIDRVFSTTNRSIAQSFQVLQNAIVRFVGQADQTTGITHVLAEGIILLANNINTAATAVALATAAFAAFRIITGLIAIVQGLAAAFVALDIAIAPVLLTLAGIAAAVTAAVIIYDKLGGSTKDLTSNVKALGEQYLGLGKASDGATASLDGNWKLIQDRQKQIDKEDAEFFRRRDDELKQWTANNKKAYDEAIKGLDELIRKEQEADKITRNAFGDMIEVTSEWARRTGAYFNEVKATQDGFDSGTTKMAQDAETNFGRITKAVGAASAAVESFSTSVVVGPDLGEARRVLGGFGVDTNTLLQKITSSDVLYGSAQGGIALQDLAGYLHTLPPNAIKYLKANFGYLFDRIDQAGFSEGFAGGGDFTVGGAGGTDSQLVQFMATPGERVIVQTPAQQKQQGGGGRPIMVTMNVVTPDAASFRRSQTQILTGLQGKLNQVSRRLG